MRSPVVLLLVAVAFVLAGCHHERARPSFTRISDDNHELRDAFDADADKARVILLVSPS
jgi:hypothetical protein